MRAGPSFLFSPSKAWACPPLTARPLSPLPPRPHLHSVLPLPQAAVGWLGLVSAEGRGELGRGDRAHYDGGWPPKKKRRPFRGPPPPPPELSSRQKKRLAPQTLSFPCSLLSFFLQEPGLGRRLGRPGRWRLGRLVRFGGRAGAPHPPGERERDRERGWGGASLMSTLPCLTRAPLALTHTRTHS